MIMALSSAEKAQLVSEFQRQANDTGTPEVQVALLTANIKKLTEHFKVNKKDRHSGRGLQLMVNKRRKLLKYLKANNLERYYDLIKRLSLRDSY